MFDPLTFKRQFPLFNQPQNQGLVYLDNAATTQRPQAVIDAVTDFYVNINANTHRSSHRLARQATIMIEQVREQAANYFGVDNAAEVVFCQGATAGLNLLASCLGQTLQPGDEIVLSRAEHHANLVPWQMAAQQYGLQLRFITGVEVTAAALAEQLTPKTKVVAVTAASNALGQKTNLAEIASLLEGKGVVWVVDGSQLAAHEPINFPALGCDFFVCAPHKFYGPSGVGLIIGRLPQWQLLPPWQGGGEMVAQVTLQATTYAEPPHRFEAGTQALSAIAGLGGLFTWLQQQNRGEMARHEQALLRYAHEQLAGLDGLKVLSQADNNVGIITLLPEAGVRLAAVDLGLSLDERDVAVRVGQHCAMPLMEQVVGAASLRASIAAYNTREDIDRLVVGIASAMKPSNTATVLVCQEATEHDDLSGCSLSYLESLTSWSARYKQVMQWAACVNPKPSIRTPTNRVDGCESLVWLQHRQIGDRHYFKLDSDARIVRGLGVLLLLLVDGKTQQEFNAMDVRDYFSRRGFFRHLSPSRRNGLQALIQSVEHGINVACNSAILGR